MGRTKEESRAYQNKLRDKIWLKCQKQMVIAAKCKMSSVWFNIWLKGRRELGLEEIKDVELFLEE